MQTIQLYIDGQKLDMFADESIQLTSLIQDVRDISKVFTDYSQTFNVPASKTNNKVFKHYYNNDIQNGYDARFRSAAIIELNHSPFRKGSIRLNRVKLKNNKAYSYELTFFGSIVSLSRVLGDDKLKNLDLSDYTHEWTYNNVLQGLETGLSFNGDSAAVIYPLISPKRRFIYDSDAGYTPIDNYANVGSALAGNGFLPQDLKPALRLIRIIEAIEEKYPLTFSRDFFGTSLFEELYMWMHRGAGQITYADGDYTMIVKNWSLVSQTDICVDELATLSNSYFDLTTTFSNISYYQTAQADLTITPADLSAKYSYIIRDIISDTILFEETNVIGVRTKSITIEDPNESESRDWRIQVEIYKNQDSNFLVYDAEWYLKIFLKNSAGFEYCYDEQDFESLNQNMIGDVLLENQTPDIKIIDLLTGLFKMFNLTAYVNDAGTIVVDTLDSYYGSYATATKHDITKYIKVDDSIIERVPLYSNIDFRFGDPSTFLSVEFEEKNGQQFGAEYFNVIIGGEYIDGSTYNVNLPFEKVLYERLVDDNNDSETNVAYGWFVSENEDTVKGNPLLFFNVNQTLGAKNIYFRSADGITVSTPATYNRPSNVNETGTQTLNFDTENDEFNLVFNEQSLFKNYYQTYIESVFNQYNRITKINAVLPIKVLSKYKLNDRFIVNGESYRINSVTSNLMSSNSQVELIEDIE